MNGVRCRRHAAAPLPSTAAARSRPSSRPAAARRREEESNAAVADDGVEGWRPNVRTYAAGAARLTGAALPCPRSCGARAHPDISLSHMSCHKRMHVLVHVEHLGH